MMKTLESRPYQHNIVREAADMFIGNYVDRSNRRHDRYKSICVESPTGSGKTAIAFLVIKELRKTYPDLLVGWVAMRRNLLAQAKLENDKYFQLADIHYMSMFDHHPELAFERQGRPLLLCLDESHHDATDSMAHLHNVLKPEFNLGLTATPFRTDCVKLIFQATIKKCGIHQLIQDGYLSQYHQYTIEAYTPETVVETYLREPERWGKSVMYFLTREHADACTNMLNAAGIPTETVTADSDRERQLAEFETGKLQVLTNMFVLCEGFNSPSLQTVFVRDSQRGPSVQMAGRVFRKYPGIQFKQVVQSKVTKWPIHRTAKPAEAFVWQDNSWRSHSLSSEIEKVVMSALITTSRITTSLPKFLTENKGKMRRFRRSGGGALIHD
jgi:superfamily II DNA or RNA helicase